VTVAVLKGFGVEAQSVRDDILKLLAEGEDVTESVTP
jgi:hypothetical protein